MTGRLRLTRELFDRLPKSVEAEGPVRDNDMLDSFHAAQTAEILAVRPDDGAFWVLVAGSLIWKPRCPVKERRVATITGWHLSFCFGRMTRMRGNPDAPGWMMSLDRGGHCDGILLGLDPNGVSASLDGLLRTEPLLPVEWVTAEPELGPVQAIAFDAREDFRAYMPEVSDEDTADALSPAVGTEGTMAEYLLNSAEQLENSGLHRSASVAYAGSGGGAAGTAARVREIYDA